MIANQLVADRFEQGGQVVFLEIEVSERVVVDSGHDIEEHAFMRPLGEKLAALARTAEHDGFDATHWREFQRISAEFVQRMLIHVQKEEAALLPLIEDTMGEEAEMRLYDVYTGNR